MQCSDIDYINHKRKNKSEISFFSFLWHSTKTQPFLNDKTREFWSDFTSHREKKMCVFLLSLYKPAWYKMYSDEKKKRINQTYVLGLS